MSKRIGSALSNASPKKRNAALSLFPLLIGGTLIVSQGCFTNADSPEDEVNTSTDDIVLQPSDREEIASLRRLAQTISIPSSAAISRIPDSGIRGAADNLRQALQQFQNSASRDGSSVRSAAESVNDAGRGLQQAIHSYLRGGGGGEDLGSGDDSIGTSTEELVLSSRDYRRCLKHVERGYILCLATATALVLQIQCNTNFANLTLGCNATL